MGRKMISATGSPRGAGRTGKGRTGAFTLFEILIVLAIIAMFTGFFLLRFDDGAAEESLSRGSTDLKGAALKAKKRAYAFRRDQFIHFTNGGFVLTESPPLAEDALPFGADVRESGGVVESFRLPPNVTMELLPPGATRWTRQPGQVWTFRASGLSDPLSVRFLYGDTSYTRLSFNVLTGLAEEETFLE